MNGTITTKIYADHLAHVLKIKFDLNKLDPLMTATPTYSKGDLHITLHGVSVLDAATAVREAALPRKVTGTYAMSFKDLQDVGGWRQRVMKEFKENTK